MRDTIHIKSALCNRVLLAYLLCLSLCRSLSLFVAFFASNALSFSVSSSSNPPIPRISMNSMLFSASCLCRFGVCLFWAMYLRQPVYYYIKCEQRFYASFFVSFQFVWLPVFFSSVFFPLNGCHCKCGAYSSKSCSMR